MSSNLEFIQDWNEVFAFKIKESDLAKPNEVFVFNALINYLKMFNFDIAPIINMMNSENPEERQNFKKKFCHYIDHLYKISDASHSFLYYDLVHPSPKKTAHLLKHLLNYLFYYNMLKDEIIPFAEEKARQKIEILDTVLKCKYENEKIEIKANMIEKTVEDHLASLPKINAVLETLSNEEKLKKEEKMEIEKAIKNYSNQLNQLKIEEELLRNDIVSQEEVDRLLSNKINLQKEIVEQEEIEKVTLVSNQDRSVTISKIQPVVKKINTAMELYTAKNLTSSKELKSKYTDLRGQHSQLSDLKNEYKQSIEKHIKDGKNLETDLNSKVKCLQKIVVSSKKDIAKQNGLLKTEINLNEELDSKLHDIENELEEENANSEFFIQSASVLVKRINLTD